MKPRLVRGVLIFVALSFLGLFLVVPPITVFTHALAQSVPLRSVDYTHLSLRCVLAYDTPPHSMSRILIAYNTSRVNKETLAIHAMP